MVKYKVLKIFKDAQTNEVYEVNQEIDIPTKRANEIEKKLGSSFLMRIDQDKKKEIE